MLSCLFMTFYFIKSLKVLKMPIMQSGNASVAEITMYCSIHMSLFIVGIDCPYDRRPLKRLLGDSARHRTLPI